MARAGCRTNGLQKLDGDDIEKSLEVLDKVLSEFEDPDSLPHIEPESPSQGNQSEDDGYMSMNGRRAKMPPDFHQPSDDSSAASPPVMMAPFPERNPMETDETDEKKSSKPSLSSSSSLSPPPPPEIAEAIISNLLPRVSPTNGPAVSVQDVLKEDGKDENHISNTKNLSPSSPSSSCGGQEKFSESKPFTGNAATSLVSNFVFKKVNNSVSAIRGGTVAVGPGGVTGGLVSGFIANNATTEGEQSTTPAQTTLPKTRPSTAIPSRYSSLPCSGPPRSFGSFDGMRAMGGGSFDDGRNVLGMGISAVHDAVLRGGVARLPEPIVNEHPVTIYPGRASPPRTRVPPRTLPGSIERHREVCRNINSNDAIDSSEILLDSANSSQLSSPLHRLAGAGCLGIVKSPSSPLVVVQQQQSQQQHFNIISNSFSSNQLVDNKKYLLSNLQIPPRKQQPNGRGNTTSSNHLGHSEKRCSDSEEFSDDSLEEGQSLPPPPPPPVVPPPPSLSAPVTPSKRGSIAWEINLDDHLPPPPPPVLSSAVATGSHANYHPHQNASSTGLSAALKKKSFKDSKSGKTLVENSSPTSAKAIIARRRCGSISGSQSSLASTPGNSCSGLSNTSPHHNLRQRSGSVEWPEPPEPTVCTTEDEAGSIYSDSDEIVPTYPSNLTGQGTYVIRKGRRERQRLSELNHSLSSSINSRLSSEGNLLGISQQNCSLLVTPNSRHSIDLGSSSHHTQLASSTVQNSILSPRSRLSLDLSSPIATSDLPHVLSNGGGGISAAQQPLQQQQQILSPRYHEFKTFTHHSFEHESNGNGGGGSTSSLNQNHAAGNGGINGNGSLTRVGSLPVVPQTVQTEVLLTPRRELAPPIEEDEEQDSESQRVAPLRQIENNISALLRGDIAIARVGDMPHPRRPLGFRPGVHKSESAKEMLLSQNAFGPLPPSPPDSSPDAEIDGFPPLPPSPQENVADDEADAEEDVLLSLQGARLGSRSRINTHHFSRADSLEHTVPAVPPHRNQPSLNTLKTRSMDAGYTRKYSSSSSSNGPGTLPGEMTQTNSSRRRLMSGAFPKRSAQSPREERRLQTSCSLPETPIFARGCDIPRTPHRRAPEAPPPPVSSGSRTAPRTTNSNAALNSSIVGIGSTLGGGRPQRSINQALASGEMLRLAGGPARGWYPKQRTSARPASTEHLDRLHRSQGSIRAWDGVGIMAGGTGTSGRKPLTLPPNLTPKFFNKSPREALRRVTSLLIRKGNSKDSKEKETKREKEALNTSAVHRSQGSTGDIPVPININGILSNSVTAAAPTTNSNTTNNNHQPKKKGFFKGFWKKSKNYSLDQQ